MKLNFKTIEIVGKNCPYFLGIKEHGPKIVFDLDGDSCQALHCHSERSSINIHQDGTIYTSLMNYSYSEEEWVDEVDRDYTNDETVKGAINRWIEENLIYRSRQFPYRVSTQRNYWGCDKIGSNLDEIIEYLKTL